ncbi:hypothetical protein GW17_00017535 [Ensete ventricosum]|nr:hypothetical protein GW17_00017535 [Ensete ventricosum]
MNLSANSSTPFLDPDPTSPSLNDPNLGEELEAREYKRQWREQQKRLAAFDKEGDSSTPLLDPDPTSPSLDDPDPGEELEAQG